MNADELRRALNEHGLRATPPRIHVLELLYAAERPLAHAEVEEALRGVTPDSSTVFRNLTDLVEAGLAFRMDFGDRIWRFEVRSPDDRPHPHFVCSSCGGIECLPDTELSLGRARVPRSVRQRSAEVILRGRCDGCMRSRS